MNIRRLVAGSLVLSMGIIDVNSISYATTDLNVIQSVDENITDSTVITMENIDDVLSYLGLSSDCFSEGVTTVNSVTTVGELKEVIEAVEENNSAENNRVNNVYSQNSLLDTTTTSTSLMSARSTSKSMILTDSHDVDSYIIDLSVTAQYSGSKWTGVGGISVDLDSDQLFITYKIASKSLSATYTSSCITVSGTVSVTAYVGIGDLGLIKVGSNTNKLRSNFYAINYIK